jgi:hypothetical protein
MLPVINPIITNDLKNSPAFGNTGVDFIVPIALMFTLESAYQVVYQI